MIEFQELDGWRVCHELTLGVYEATKPLLESEPEIAHQLRLSALLAIGKLARGAGTGSKAMFRQCAEMSLGHLSEVRYHLDLAHVMGLVCDDVHQQLSGLRGRASFYLANHLVSVTTPQEPPEGLDWDPDWDDPDWDDPDLEDLDWGDPDWE
jgi:four helix bundle protein